MKTLVTGGTGFIGSHLVKALIEEGRDVRCLVRKTSNIAPLKGLGIELIYGDLLDKKSLRNAVEGINIIYHLAGEVYSRRVGDYFKVNVNGTENLLEECLSEKIQRFVYFSSIAAVGPNPSRDILLNEESPCNPITPYGRSKYKAEQMVSRFFTLRNLPTVIIRPPTIYGPGQSHIITKIFQTTQAGRFFIIGNGQSLRSLCYIDNFIQGVMLAEKSTGSTGKIYFISDETVYTFKEIIETIAIIEGVRLSEFQIPKLVANMCGGVFRISDKVFNRSFLSLYTIATMVIDLGCDISKARKELGYAPHVNFMQGIKNTVTWCKENGLIN